ncbi:antibiotic biosynthesis monooxygenase [Mucilaginibacter terrenus]|uniref:Antibiotic biosynthesis monooxygenase n=1 Tax=Mucilaginibacter terrenus TaxID=2482727 RepID=A0A3E2NLK6_9SPHI|nr:antibiotic biosynthesis monooxygenase family protein [Mucilaginibacter terrenus]RFZ81851.1 antibiotic biosynthesis monooxygenase [Mucilaginibacter terrenus]
MKDQSIHVFAKWQVAEGKLATVLELLPQVAVKSSDEQGNLYYNVFQDRATPDTIILSEAYRNEAALTEHRNSEHYTNIVIGKIIPLLANREVVLTNKLAL